MRVLSTPGARQAVGEGDEPNQKVQDVISSLCPESAIFDEEENRSFYSITPGKGRFLGLLAYATILKSGSGFLDHSLIPALDQLLHKFGLGGAAEKK